MSWNKTALINCVQTAVLLIYIDISKCYNCGASLCVI